MPADWPHAQYIRHMQRLVHLLFWSGMITVLTGTSYSLGPTLPRWRRKQPSARGKVIREGIKREDVA